MLKSKSTQAEPVLTESENNSLATKEAPPPFGVEEIDALQTEKVTERFANGSDRIHRHVTMDAEGNFQNHGDYQEWNSKGDLVASGRFAMGLREGIWIRVWQPGEAKLFETYPYLKFKPPFQSSVEFASDKMNGVWTITDADNRIVSQVQLADGLRDGPSTWYHPNGKIYYQADYRNGILHGAFVEKNAEGQTVRDDLYTDGKRMVTEKDMHPKKNVKSEMQYLTPGQTLVTRDDWVNCRLASYEANGEKSSMDLFKYSTKTDSSRAKGPMTKVY